MEAQASVPYAPLYSARYVNEVLTNLLLDDDLVDEAKRLGRHRTRQEAVTAALKEYVRRSKQAAALDLFDQIPYDPSYDYKAERQRRSV